MLSKTKVRLKNFKNDSSILSQKTGQKWPYFGYNPTVCDVMVAYLGKWASGHKVLSNIYGIEEVLSLACLMPIQDHKRKWMALLFWQFRKQLCSLTRLLPPSSPISGNPLLIRLHFYPFIFKPIFK